MSKTLEPLFNKKEAKLAARKVLPDPPLGPVTTIILSGL